MSSLTAPPFHRMLREQFFSFPSKLIGRNGIIFAVKIERNYRNSSYFHLSDESSR